MRLDIAYRLHFTYTEPVSESQNEIRVRPLDDIRQRVLSYRLTTAPATRVLQTRDYFGTTVDHLGIRVPHDELLITAEASVETTPINGGPVPVSCERLSDQQFVNQHVEYLAPSQHVQWGELVNQVATWAVRGAADDVVQRVEAVSGAVSSVLSYVRGSTSIGVTLEELIDGGHGVCQDFAHLAVGMLRCIGVPARYVSGYLFALDETRLGEDLDAEELEAETGAPVASAEVAGHGFVGEDLFIAQRPAATRPTVISVQTHAWIEAALPGYGWYGLDPTNGGLVSERHVVIGHGRDYNDIPPVRGVFNGAAEATVDAEVLIARPTAPISMVTEPIRRQTRVPVDMPVDTASGQQAAQQQQ